MQQYSSAVTDLLHHPSWMRISQYTSASHTHAHTHLPLPISSPVKSEACQTSAGRVWNQADYGSGGFYLPNSSLLDLPARLREARRPRTFGKLFEMSLCVCVLSTHNPIQQRERGGIWVHACLWKLQQWWGDFSLLQNFSYKLGLRCCQCTVSRESLQTERLGEKYYLKAYCDIFSHRVWFPSGVWETKTQCLLMCGPTLLGEKKKKKERKKEAITCSSQPTTWPNGCRGFLFVIPRRALPPSPERPLCISSSKWDSVFDVQTSFQPLWETKAEVCSPC